jgi:hypothetical protein
MEKLPNKLYWSIRGYESTKTIFDMRVEFGQFTVGQIQHLLQALAAKAGLSFTEIVGAYPKRRTKIANNLLEVHKEFGYSTYMCGSNPHFTASVVDTNGNILRRRTIPVLE